MQTFVSVVYVYDIVVVVVAAAVLLLSLFLLVLLLLFKMIICIYIVVNTANVRHSYFIYDTYALSLPRGRLPPPPPHTHIRAVFLLCKRAHTHKPCAHSPTNPHTHIHTHTNQTPMTTREDKVLFSCLLPIFNSLPPSPEKTKTTRRT